MSYYFRAGNTFRVTDSKALDIHESLPADSYIVKFDDMTGQYFLEMVDRFSSMPKYYGNIHQNVERVYNTFLDRPATTGVMLSGEKGSGKTLLAKELSIEGYKRGFPTIIINRPFVGDVFNKFIQDIGQPAVILFDEFEKVYDNKEQEKILTLLDGTFPTKKLFVMTCNDKWRIDAHMRNRPGRIYYFFDFVGLGPEFIEEYCSDNLENLEFTSQIISVASLFREFNFDMLKAMVEEMNRYGETPQQVLEILNVKPEYDNGQDLAYEIAFVDGTNEGWIHSWPMVLNKAPLSQARISITLEKKDDEDAERTVVFHRDEISNIDGVSGTYSYTNAAGDSLVLTRRKEQKFDFFKAL